MRVVTALKDCPVCMDPDGFHKAWCPHFVLKNLEELTRKFCMECWVFTEQEPHQSFCSQAKKECVFCEIIAGRSPAKMVYEWEDTVAFHPLRPVTVGHMLIVPKRHVTDFIEDPDVTALTMRRAAEYAHGECNLVTSAGPSATQTQFHLHVHIVPRKPNDGMALPWTPCTRKDLQSG